MPPAHQGHGEAAARSNLLAIPASVGFVGVDQTTPFSEAEHHWEPVAGHVVVDLHAVR